MRTQIPRAAFVLLCGLLAACRPLTYQGGARPVAPQQLDETWLRAAPTPVVLQEEPKDCGLAALAMIAGAWGHRWKLGELQRVAPPGEQGVKLGKLRDLARARGLDAFAVAGTHADLLRELENRRPVLLGLLLPFERRRALAHYEVAIAIHPRDGSVITLDPATGKHMRRTRQVLEQEWKAAGYAMLVVVGDHARRPGSREAEAMAAGNTAGTGKRPSRDAER
jgi:ABC-type bacteriocin/lantibiotic exporter with double-glycine peptidase domain